MLPHLRQLEKPRPLGQEQPDGELDRRHVGDEIQLHEEPKQVEIALQRGPRHERDKGRRQGQVRLPGEPDDADEVAPCMPFVEQLEDAVVDRLHRRGDEQAAGGGQPRQVAGLVQQVLDLYGHVVGEGGEFRGEPLNQAQGMAHAVEEIRIPEGDVPRTRGDLPADVLHHHIRLDDAEASAIDRHHRAVPAQMLAPAAGLGVADRPALVLPQLQIGIAGERGQVSPVGNAEALLGQRDHRLALAHGRGIGTRRRQPLVQADQPALELAAENGLAPEPAQEVLVHRRVEAVEAQMDAWVQGFQAGHDGRRQPRGRMHRQVQGDKPGRAHRRLVQALDRKIDAPDTGPRRAQPRRRRGQAERLMAQLVGREKDDLHARPPGPSNGITTHPRLRWDYPASGG